MIPETGDALAIKITTDLQALAIGNNGVAINSPGGVGTAHIENVLINCRITLDIDPNGLNEEFGLSILLKALRYKIHQTINCIIK